MLAPLCDFTLTRLKNLFLCRCASLERFGILHCESFNRSYLWARFAQKDDNYTEWLYAISCTAIPIASRRFVLETTNYLV